MKVTIKRYGSRHWAVYLDGELLAVTVYKKGALAVAATIRGLSARREPESRAAA